MTDRADLIVQYFDYLVNEYGFRIERKEFDSQTMGNAVVVFGSSKFGIEVVIDRDQVFIEIGSQSDPRKEWFELTDIIKYYAPYVEKVYVFPEKTATNTWNEVVEIQLERLAILLRQYCEPVLKGESWMKEEIQKIEEKRAAEIRKKFGLDPAS